ncbi:MAG: PASTA domain-containing protein [Vicinamibacterales bacterium]
MALRRRVRALGRLVVIGSALAATFLVFAAVAVQVAVRAREVTVPDVTGLAIADAASRLGQEQLSLRVDAAQRPSTEVPPGQILGQDPRAGTVSRRQRTVRVWVSAGPKVAHMPGVVGESERSARIRLSQEGLDATSVSEIRSDAFTADQVVAQEPAPGQPAAAVRLLVSRGADSTGYVMPDLIGLAGEPAAAVLRQQGFRVSFVAQQSASGVPPGLIVRQTPAGGYQVHPGDAISLEVAR